MTGYATLREKGRRLLLAPFPRTARALLPALAVGSLIFWAGAAYAAPAAYAEVPFGDRVSAAIVNYDRAKPHIATAGLLLEGGVEEVKRLGFAAIIDLRTPEEGTALEKAAAEAEGLKYYNIPVGKETPGDETVDLFARLAEDTGNYPLLVHCASANRAGAMWTLYRVRKGVPFDLAIEEGRTGGMKPDRENAVRRKLGRALLAE